jgi:TRAP-type C4-dicarboxylate transport system permease small subunit
MAQMWLEKIFRSFERVVVNISRASNSIGIMAVMALMLLITADVFSRFVFNNSIKGVFELVTVGIVICVALAFAYTSIRDGLISVSVIVEHFSPKVQAAIDMFNTLLGIALFGLISWKSIQQAGVYWAKGSVTSGISVPIFPFMLVFAFGCIILCLVLVIRLVKSTQAVLKK